MSEAMTPAPTPEQTYQEICKRECRLCAAGHGTMPMADGLLHYSDFGSVEPYRPATPSGRCSAPSRDQVISRQAAQLETQAAEIAGMQAALAKAPHSRTCKKYQCSCPGMAVNSELCATCPCNCYLSTLTDSVTSLGLY